MNDRTRGAFRRLKYRDVVRIHDDVIRLDPQLQHSRVHPEARRDMLRRFQAILDAIEAHAPSPPVIGQLRGLEVGVGEGTLWLTLAEFCPHIQWEGVDIPRRHAAYQEAFDSLIRSRGLQLSELDLTRSPLPHPDLSFDIVTLSEVVEHLPPNVLLPTLREIFRVLRPGGLLVTTSPNLTSLMNRVLLLFGASPFHLPIPEDVAGCATYPHIHLYTAGEFAALCRHVGFKVVRVRHLTYLSGAFCQCGRPLRNALLHTYRGLEGLLGSLWPRLRDGWLVASVTP